MTRAPAPSQTAVEPVAAGVLGDENDLHSVAHALDIGSIGTPYRASQGSLYCDYQTYRIADFQDYGLALAATVLFNNAKAIKAALSTLTAQTAARVAAERERDEAWGDLSKAAGAIGSVRFMDPPDGGDVTLAEQVARMREALEAAESEVATLKGRVAELEAGLTPSARTKAALIGEFSFAIDVMEPDADGDDAEVVSREITVPWTTIKEIMSAIRRLTRQEKNNG